MNDHQSSILNPQSSIIRASGATGRDGFSLLEVILALTILGGAIAVLGELSRLGMRNAERARDLTQAQLLAESKLAEITSGLAPPEPEQGVPFEPIDEEEGDESEWNYSIEATSVGEDGLLEVRVTVTKDLPTEQKPVEFTLVRWMVESGGEAEGFMVDESGSL